METLTKKANCISCVHLLVMMMSFEYNVVLKMLPPVTHKNENVFKVSILTKHVIIEKLIKLPFTVQEIQRAYCGS